MITPPPMELSPQLMDAVKLLVGLFGTPLVNVARSWLVNGTSAVAVKLVGTAEITVSPKAKV